MEVPALTEDEREEHRLALAARAGDRDAFRALVERYQHRLFRYLLRQHRCDPETAADLTQEVLLRMYRGFASYDPRARLSTWIYKIATNVVISEHRHRKALKRDRWTFSLDAPSPDGDERSYDPEDAAPRPEESAHHAEIGAAVRAAIAALPDEFRQTVLLRDLQGLSYEEIAEVVGIPPGTVRSRIHRGRLLLQQALEEYRP